MKIVFVLIGILILPSLSYAEEKTNCKSALSKLKPSCNFIGKGVDGMTKFSAKNKTIGQSMGIEKKPKSKSLKEFTKENKYITDTIKNHKKK